MSEKTHPYTIVGPHAKRQDWSLCVDGKVVESFSHQADAAFCLQILLENEVRAMRRLVEMHIKVLNIINYQLKQQAAQMANSKLFGR